MRVFYSDHRRTLYHGDARRVLSDLPGGSVDCFVTSPPYFNQREYGSEEFEVGREDTVEEYIGNLRDIFSQAHRVLADDGNCFVNIGDKYYNKGKHKKSMANAPERFVLMMEELGWIKRNVLIWWKPAIVPHSGDDKFTPDFEFIYFFTKNQDHYFKTLYEPVSDATMKIAEEGYEQKPSKSINYGGLSHTNQNKWYKKVHEAHQRGETPMRIMRAVWNFSYRPCNFDHTAVFPPELPARCIDAGCKPDGVVMDMFMGSGTTAEASEILGRKWIGSELVEKNCQTIIERMTPYIHQKTLDDVFLMCGGKDCS